MCLPEDNLVENEMIYSFNWLSNRDRCLVSTPQAATAKAEKPRL